MKTPNSVKYKGALYVKATENAEDIAFSANSVIENLVKFVQPYSKTKVKSHSELLSLANHLKNFEEKLRHMASLMHKASK